jgi:DNA polymerase III sliding clamp (beta) subunit (PCNA family)
MVKDKQLVATDLETMVVLPLPEADDMACLIPYNDAVKTIQYIPGAETLHIELKDGRIVMSWSDGSMTLDTMKVEDYPAVPDFKPVSEASLDADTLIPAMFDVLGYAATETDRPVLNGVSLILGEPVEVAAGDGFRMAHKVLPLKFPLERILIVPSSSVRVLQLLWSKTPRTPPVTDSLIPAITAKKFSSVAVDEERGLRFVFGKSATAIVKLIAGSPPSWIQLIPKTEPKYRASVMGNELELAVRRAYKLAKEGAGIIRMVFKDGSAIISANHEGQNVESSISVISTHKGDSSRVGLNAKYLLDYLKGKEGIVTITVTEEKSPVGFRYQAGPTVLIMPMFVQWPDKTEPAAEVKPEAEAAAAAPAEGTTEAAAK